MIFDLLPPTNPWEQAAVAYYVVLMVGMIWGAVGVALGVFGRPRRYIHTVAWLEAHGLADLAERARARKGGYIGDIWDEALLRLDDQRKRE